ncbi:hypothetical protein ACR2XN_28820, partial [Klebsiella pneumoniae]
MSTELYHLHVTLKSLTKENARIRAANVLLTERNALLETQFLDFERIKLDCQIAKDDLEAVLKREDGIKKQLDKELETMAKWVDSKNVATNIIKSHGVKILNHGYEEESSEKLDANSVSDSESTDSDRSNNGTEFRN